MGSRGLQETTAFLSSWEKEDTACLPTADNRDGASGRALLMGKHFHAPLTPAPAASSTPVCTWRPFSESDDTRVQCGAVVSNRMADPQGIMLLLFQRQH